MTTLARHKTTLRRAARRTCLLAVLGITLLAAPARADVPEGWGGSAPEPVDMMHTLLVLVLVPIGLVVLIAVLCYLPSMIRGERLLPDPHGGTDASWLGGPAQGAKELPAADEDARVGGASGGW